MAHIFIVTSALGSAGPCYYLQLQMEQLKLPKSRYWLRTWRRSSRRSPPGHRFILFIDAATSVRSSTSAGFASWVAALVVVGYTGVPLLHTPGEFLRCRIHIRWVHSTCNACVPSSYRGKSLGDGCQRRNAWRQSVEQIQGGKLRQGARVHRAGLVARGPQHQRHRRGAQDAAILYPFFLALLRRRQWIGDQELACLALPYLALQGSRRAARLRPRVGRGSDGARKSRIDESDSLGFTWWLGWAGSSYEAHVDLDLVAFTTKLHVPLQSPYSLSSLNFKSHPIFLYSHTSLFVAKIHKIFFKVLR
jgi:hypothetical protein